MILVEIIFVVDCDAYYRISIVPGEFFDRFPQIDVILASDCFFDPSLFQDLLATIWLLLEQNPHSKCIFSYQERSAEWTIADLLRKWRLKCDLVEPDSWDANCVFLHQQPQTTATIHLAVITFI